MNKNTSSNQKKEPLCTDLKKQIFDLKDKFLRATSENQNIRKRFNKEIQNSNNYAITNFAKDMVEICEDIYRCLNSIKRNKSNLYIIEGINLILFNIQKSFSKYSIKRIYPKGKKFNCNFHEAISQVINNKIEDNIIVEVIQAGYSIGNRNLKAAQVIVSKKNKS